MTRPTWLCEATGLIVKRNADGRGTCPLCGDAWHVLSMTGRLRPHARTLAAARLTPDEVAQILDAAQREAQQ